MTRTGDREIGVVSGRVGMYAVVYNFSLIVYSKLRQHYSKFKKDFVLVVEQVRDIAATELLTILLMKKAIHVLTEGL